MRAQAHLLVHTAPELWYLLAVGAEVTGFWMPRFGEIKCFIALGERDKTMETFLCFRLKTEYSCDPKIPLRFWSLFATHISVFVCVCVRACVRVCVEFHPLVIKLMS